MKIELSIIYTRPDFKYLKAFLKILKMHNLEGTFRETVKILELIITIQMTTVEAERCFSIVKKDICFLRNTMGKERLSALSM